MANSLLPPKLFIDTTATAFTGTCVVKSIIVSNSNGAAAVCTVDDNTSAAGNRILECEMLDQTTIQFFFGDKGVQMDIGVHVVVAANMHAMIVLA